MATNDMDAVTLADFAAIVTDIGETVTLNRATKAIGASTGSETLSYGGNVSISGVMQVEKVEVPADKEGEVAMADAILFAKPADSVDRNDKITHDSIVYLVKDVTQRFSVDRCVLFRWQ